MPGQPNSVKTRIECARCGSTVDICVPVRIGVPEFLRCDHPTHGGVSKDGAGDITCPDCGCPWRISGDRLAAAVEEAMHRNMNQWHRLGVVVIVCGDR